MGVCVCVCLCERKVNVLNLSLRFCFSLILSSHMVAFIFSKQLLNFLGKQSPVSSCKKKFSF